MVLTFEKRFLRSTPPFSSPPSGYKNRIPQIDVVVEKRQHDHKTLEHLRRVAFLKTA
ncbi:hypothetical protein PsorP6_013374 [Peronosclerospora sorghi]|uniref:Uncharacterized protein n=1 Tax=Peronosclerospora sorghi TaxID=230839 RepID=A0ACC0WJ21_9STRA|nr:hypothetical protein PsorP6_013374 [Peronosclerospora sorghi]